ncbi:uncharacterized protein LOC126654434 isoform X2 [Mercurialis annua]|uniref:uncharacterized protein LOC126654434 isoform X2 n=1 Tax=Mercurialis annua TaxID=3986 RepID=UPI00216050E7|nr:uncharacterized protein LOC126654434 isoform X2 [Mercurialis annua]
MCGRARCTLRADDIPRACHQTGGPARSVNMDRYRPYYNVSPGSNLPVVYSHTGGDGGSNSGNGDGYCIQCMAWGLIPSFTKKSEKPDFYKMFNARSESVGEKASFRRLLPKNQCLVAVEGFYEWKKDGSKKQPYYIHFKDGRPLVFAALYDSWQNSEGEILYTFTILTTSSSSALQWLHDRMPIILGDKGAIDTWLNGSSSSSFNVVLKPYENSDLIPLKTEDKNTISKFFSRKDVKREQESNPQESTSDKSVKMDLPQSVKEENENEEKFAIPSSTQLVSNVPTVPCEDETKCQIPDHDVKSNVSTIPHEDDTTSQIKRHHEEVMADVEVNTDENIKLKQSPVKKKANLNGGGDKQPTLLSYFSKK